MEKMGSGFIPVTGAVIPNPAYENTIFNPLIRKKNSTNISRSRCPFGCNALRS